MSSLAADPPAEDLNSMPESTVWDVIIRVPRDKKEAFGGIDALRQSSHEIKDPSSPFPCSLQGTRG